VRGVTTDVAYTVPKRSCVAPEANAQLPSSVCRWSEPTSSGYGSRPTEGSLLQNTNKGTYQCAHTPCLRQGIYLPMIVVYTHDHPDAQEPIRCGIPMFLCE